MCYLSHLQEVTADSNEECNDSDVSNMDISNTEACVEVWM